MLTFITLAIEPLQVAAKFYQQHFSQFNSIYTPAKNSQPEMLLLDNKKIKIALIKPEDFLLLTGKNTAGQALLSLEFDNQQQVKKQCSALQVAGCRIVHSPKALPWGGFAGFIEDPFGLSWEIHCRDT